MSPRVTTLGNRQKWRILIVEDEPVLALTLEERLEDAGFEISGVAGRLGTALAMIESGGFDAALLDVNLAGVSASPAASALAKRGLPFIVMSGYLPEQQQSIFSGALFVQKPYQVDKLIRNLRSILSTE